MKILRQQGACGRAEDNGEKCAQLNNAIAPGEPLAGQQLGQQSIFGGTEDGAVHAHQKHGGQRGHKPVTQRRRKSHAQHQHGHQFLQGIVAESPLELRDNQAPEATLPVFRSNRESCGMCLFHRRGRKLRCYSKLSRSVLVPGLERNSGIFLQSILRLRGNAGNACNLMSRNQPARLANKMATASKTARPEKTSWRWRALDCRSRVSPGASSAPIRSPRMSPPMWPVLSITGTEAPI